MNPTAINREWLLVRRPQGRPEPADFVLRNGSISAPGDGEVLVRVLYAMMDPAIRGFMGEGGTYAAPIPLGTPIRGMVVGKVVMSRSESLREGAVVFGFGAWS